ncbi:MAG: hypothetical protein DCC71_18305 [Proteobacteria bacterium]|nr:MAG: hypothetical protein DCC71_18305 [Pseudomonadota bacterium]
MRIARLAARGFGLAITPWVMVGRTLWGARPFQPEGELYLAEVTPESDDADAAALGERLAGPALVRFSAALWDEPGARLDLLGCAIRFGWSGDPDDDAGAQDVVLASFHHLATLPLAALLTDARNYLANDYYSVLHFRTPEMGEVELRVTTPRGIRVRDRARAARLARAVAEGPVTLLLEARRAHWRAGWRSVARIALTQRAPVAPSRIAFSPFHDGRGIEPVGALGFAYVASDRLRRRATRRDAA